MSCSSRCRSGDAAPVPASLGNFIEPPRLSSGLGVYHYYLQHRASGSLRNAAIDAEPSGRSRRLGSGVDLVVGLQEIWDRLDARVVVVVGYFMPSAAFPGATGGGAWVVSAEVQFRFLPRLSRRQVSRA